LSGRKPKKYHAYSKDIRKSPNIGEGNENAAVVRKRTTAVYAEGGRNPLFKCVSQWQKYVTIGRKTKTAAAASHLPFCET